MGYGCLMNTSRQPTPPPFLRYMQQPLRFGLLQRNVFRDWLALKGIVQTPSQLHLLQLSPCVMCGAPWLVHR